MKLPYFLFIKLEMGSCVDVSVNSNVLCLHELMFESFVTKIVHMFTCVFIIGLFAAET